MPVSQITGAMPDAWLGLNKKLNKWIDHSSRVWLGIRIFKTSLGSHNVQPGLRPTAQRPVSWLSHRAQHSPWHVVSAQELQQILVE